MYGDVDQFAWIAASLQEGASSLNDEEAVVHFVVGVVIMVSVLFGFVHKVTYLFCLHSISVSFIYLLNNFLLHPPH